MSNQLKVVDHSIVKRNASFDIVKDFPISDQEYHQLESEFGNLCHFQAWRLIRWNSFSNLADDPDDFIQDLKISMLQAGSYYKRQVFMESCFQALARVIYSLDRQAREELLLLRGLWKDRRRHGARKQKFGPQHERSLQDLVDKYLPPEARPRRDKPLVIDKDVRIYIRSCTWNQQRSMGKKIKKESAIRVGQVSLSEFDVVSCYS